MIEYAARKLSIRINKIIPDSNVNIMAYSIGMKLNFYLIITLTIVIGLMTGHLIDSCMAMCGCAILRRLTGGRHLSLTACLVFSVLLFTTSPILPISFTFMILLTCLTILLLALYSKVSAKNKSLSLALVCTNFLIFSPSLALVFAVQAASLINRREVRENDGKTY